MAKKEKAELVTKLGETIDKALGFLSKDLTIRADWGTVTFEEAALDFKRAKDVLSYLRILPVESLTDQATNQIISSVNSLVPVLEQIDKFALSDSAVSTRNSLVQQLHNQVDAFYTQASPWIPFLAYQKGDVAENIGKLSDAVETSRDLIEKAKTDIEAKRSEMESIISAARSASASAGAAVFTKDFEEESTGTNKIADKWLVAAIVGLIVTIATAAGFWLIAHNGAEMTTNQLVQEVAAKIIILSMLITATAWCGKNYKALKHLSTLNRHRALSLRTLKAFSAAASDEQTKNAVLMEATRAVFNAGSTGYLDGGSQDDSTLKIIEVAKTVADRN